ncbi:MAG: hypothetical protein Q9167_006751 [Letrouitia subvulpina]
MSGRDRGSRGRGRGDRGGVPAGYRGRGDDGSRGRGDEGSRGRRDGGGYAGGGGRGGGRGGRGGRPERDVYRPVDGVPPPNSKVQKKEDELHKVLVKTKSPSEFPLRPGFGTRGSPVLLFTNSFELIPEPNLLLYRYGISIEPLAKNQPDITGKKLSQLVKQLLQTDQFVDHEDGLVTDFRSNIIAREQLLSQPFDQVMQYVAENEDEPAVNAPKFRVQVEETGVLTVSQLTDFLTSSDMSRMFEDKKSIVQALNIFVRHYAKESQSVGTIGTAKSFPLNPDEQSGQTSDLGGGLRAIRGIFSSIRVATCRILVNINVTAAAFYDPIRLDMLIRNYGLPPRVSKLKVDGFLKRLRVEVIHLPSKKNKAGVVIPRIKTIFGLATKNDGTGAGSSGPPPKVQDFGAGARGVQFFLRDEGPEQSSSGKKAGGAKGKKAGGQPGPGSGSGSQGRYVSVEDYFKQRYNRVVSDLAMPVVNVGNRANPSYLLAQCCLVLPGQSSQSKLNSHQSQRMIDHAVRPPFKNAASIVNEGPSIVGLFPETNVKMVTTPDPTFCGLRHTDIWKTQFGISIPTSLLTVPGRVLQGPKVSYKDHKHVIPSDGSWNLRDKVKFNSAGNLPRWSYLMISTAWQPNPFNAESLWNSVKNFHKVLNDMGIAGSAPVQGLQIHIKTHEEIDSEIEGALKKATVQAQLRLVLVIFPDKDTEMYNAVKHTADVKLGIHTVCLVSKQFGKGHPSYFANVALKVNLKLGGINHVVEDRLGIIKEDKTMVIGIDVTHPSPSSSSKAPSIASMVASIDHWLGQWPAELRIQQRRKEMVTDLDQMLKTRLELWQRLGFHKAYPENLLIYRDGVSEGQYAAVIEEELPLLRKACREMYPATETKRGIPNITIIVVGKRHHTRFYPTNLANADANSNPKNGTIVDRGVTEARNWDFFLQAHTALQGTARPAHYYVVLDEIFTRRGIKPPFQTTADVLEDLTHNMSYLYGRATKAVSLCPPAYYADIACERARRYLSKLFEQSTPSGTLASTSVSGGTGESRAEDMLVHPNLKNTMFYI